MYTMIFFLATNICLDHRLLLSLLSKKHGSHLYSLCMSNSLYHESKLKKNTDVSLHNQMPKTTVKNHQSRNIEY